MHSAVACSLVIPLCIVSVSFCHCSLVICGSLCEVYVFVFPVFSSVSFQFRFLHFVSLSLLAISAIINGCFLLIPICLHLRSVFGSSLHTHFTSSAFADLTGDSHHNGPSRCYHVEIKRLNKISIHTSESRALTDTTVSLSSASVPLIWNKQLSNWVKCAPPLCCHCCATWFVTLREQFKLMWSLQTLTLWQRRWTMKVDGGCLRG